MSTLPFLVSGRGGSTPSPPPEFSATGIVLESHVPVREERRDVPRPPRCRRRGASAKPMLRRWRQHPPCSFRCRGGQSVPSRVRGVYVVRDVPGAPRPFGGEREARAGGGEALLGLASGGFRCPGGTSVPPLVRVAVLARRVVRGSARALGGGAGRGAAARGCPGALRLRSWVQGGLDLSGGGGEGKNTLRAASLLRVCRGGGGGR